jgi:cystathionine gamma-synthase
MADVRGYEEKESRVVEALKSGYPRFVTHEFVRQLVDFYLDRESLSGRGGVLIPSRRAADDALDRLGPGFGKLEVEASLYLVYCEGADAQRLYDLRKFVQHAGCGISSRQAEDLLLRHGLIQSRFEEAALKGAVQSRVEANLAGLIGCRESDVLVCASGMNAFYAGFRAVQEFNRSRGRGVWLQLGWLYLDSGKILEEFLDEEETLECLYDVLDTDAVIARIRSLGRSLGAVVVECPSNPLLRVCDLRRIANAVREQGGVMVVDPTIASVYNVDVLPFADLLVTSLTKYASIEGDIMIGALAVNAASPFYGDLVLRTSSFYMPPYSRDLARLAVEMEAAPESIRKINANAAKLYRFLRAHKAVKKVHFAGCSEHIEEIAKGDEPVGAVITVELSGDMGKFYDAVRVMKGPSFGTRYTLICPFMYLAHYDLVTTEEGRAYLASVGIDPELVRISVGEEDYGTVEQIFRKALGVCVG